MTKRFLLGVLAAGTLTWTVGCAREVPTTPTDASVGSSELSGTSSASALETTTTSAVVTLQPDLTADPASVTVREWDKVLFVNNSGQFVTIRSYNCTEFNLLRIPAGYSLRTSYFTPAGKTCDYFAWDVDWSRQIFVGQVLVP